MQALECVVQVIIKLSSHGSELKKNTYLFYLIQIDAVVTISTSDIQVRSPKRTRATSQTPSLGDPVYLSDAGTDDPLHVHHVGIDVMGDKGAGVGERGLRDSFIDEETDEKEAENERIRAYLSSTAAVKGIRLGTGLYDKDNSGEGGVGSGLGASGDKKYGKEKDQVGGTARAAENEIGPILESGEPNILFVDGNTKYSLIYFEFYLIIFKIVFTRRWKI